MCSSDLSRGHIRTSAPASHFGFSGFSPFALPRVIEIAEAIPFIELTAWDHRKLYDLKGEVIRRGIQSVCNVEMPIFEKRRFQHGAIDNQRFSDFFPMNEADYRQEFLQAFGGRRLETGGNRLTSEDRRRS